MNKQFELLRHFPIFAQLNDHFLQEISEIVMEKKFKKSTIIFMEGEKGEAVFFIKAGKIKISKLSIDGRELILNIYGIGDVFAEVTLFNDVNYPATAEAIEDATVWMILNEKMEEKVRKNSELGLEYIKILSKRLFDSQEKLKHMALNDTHVRTAQVLIKLAQEHGKEKNGIIEFQIPISRQELANIIGTARETVSRALSQLKKDNVIEIKGKSISIKDMKKLKKWIGA